MMNNELRDRDVFQDPEPAAFIGMIKILVLGVFLGTGGMMGFVMSQLFARQVDLAALIGAFVFPLAYLVSYAISSGWLPLGVGFDRTLNEQVELTGDAVSPAKRIYRRRSALAIPCSCIVAITGGTAIGLLSTTPSWLPMIFYGLVGLAYGGMYYVLAQFDMLPRAIPPTALPA